MQHLLEVTNLQTHFPTRAGLVRAVDGVTFHIDSGELLGRFNGMLPQQFDLNFPERFSAEENGCFVFAHPP